MYFFVAMLFLLGLGVLFQKNPSKLKNKHLGGNSKETIENDVLTLVFKWIIAGVVYLVVGVLGLILVLMGVFIVATLVMFFFKIVVAIIKFAWN